MKEKTLEKIAIATTIIGILILLYASEIMNLNITEIGSISQEKIDLEVKITGIITSLSKLEELTIIEVKDNTGTINVIFFEKLDINLEEGDEITISGKVQDYEGEIQIAGNRIYS